MNWVVILIIIVTIAMVTGPLMLMQPSSRERAQAAIRQAALRKGLRVRTLPANVAADLRGMIVYELRWSKAEAPESLCEWRLAKQKFSHGIHFSDAWDWEQQADLDEEQETLLKQTLDMLPDSVSVLGVSEIGVYCCWSEKSGEEVLVSIYDALFRIRNLHESPGKTCV